MSRTRVAPDSGRTLYPVRRILLGLALVAPVLVLGGVWWLVTQVLMTPAVPDTTTPADRLARFMAHAQGLPRLNVVEFEAFLKEQMPRLARDDAFHKRFLLEIRTSSPEEQEAFREHLLDAFKPLVMRDVRAFHGLAGAARAAFVDDRIVDYNRTLGGELHVNKGDLFGEHAPGSAELLDWLIKKTTEEERQMGIAYIQVLAARVAEILAEPELKAEFEARIAAGDS